MQAMPSTTPSATPGNTPTDSSDSGSQSPLAAGVGGAAAVLVLALVVCVFGVLLIVWWKRKTSKEAVLANGHVDNHLNNPGKCRSGYLYILHYIVCDIHTLQVVQETAMQFTVTSQHYSKMAASTSHHPLPTMN